MVDPTGLPGKALSPGVALPRQCELALYEKLAATGEPDPYLRTTRAVGPL